MQQSRKSNLCAECLWKLLHGAYIATFPSRNGDLRKLSPEVFLMLTRRFVAALCLAAGPTAMHGTEAASGVIQIFNKRRQTRGQRCQHCRSESRKRPRGAADRSGGGAARREHHKCYDNHRREPRECGRTRCSTPSDAHRRVDAAQARVWHRTVAGKVDASPTFVAGPQPTPRAHWIQRKSRAPRRILKARALTSPSRVRKSITIPPT
jgi:hypothetical protein